MNAFVYFRNLSFKRIFPRLFQNDSIYYVSARMMTKGKWWVVEYYGKKTKADYINFLSPKEWKKTLREILTGFTLICLVNRSTKGKEKCLPNMLLGVKLFKRGKFRVWINGGNSIHPYRLFCGVKNLQLLPT